MDESMEDLLRSIIHIDKSASKLREELQLQVNERREQINSEIEKMKHDIVETEMYKLERYKANEMEIAQARAEEILEGANREGSVMYEKYKKLEEEFVKGIFKELTSS